MIQNHVTRQHTTRRHSIPKYLAAMAAALLILTLPFAATGTAEAAPDNQVERVEVHQVDVSGDEAPDGEVRQKVRVVVATPDGEDDAKRFVWRGESKDGESFVWKNEDGQAIELPAGHEMFFSPGVQRGFLGVELTELTPELRSHFGANEDRGVLIGRVLADSPAQRAGLRVGDVLTHVDGEPVAGSFDVTRRIGSRSAGEVVGLEVLREGRVEILSATLEERERPQVDVRKLFIHRDGEDGGPHAFKLDIDSEGIEDAMAGVRAYFESDEWETEMEKMGEDLRRQMEALELELEGLEKSLEIELDEEIHFGEEEVEVEPDSN